MTRTRGRFYFIRVLSDIEPVDEHLQAVELLRLWMADWQRTGVRFTSTEWTRAREVALGVLRCGHSVEEAFEAGRESLLSPPQPLHPPIAVA